MPETNIQETPIPDYPRGITFEQVWAALMEDRKRQEEDRKRQEEDRKRQEEDRKRQEEEDRKRQEEDKERQKTSKEEFDQWMKQSREEFDQRIRETEKLVKETSRQIGGLNNSFGELAQHLVAPNIIEKFNELDFNFTKCSLNVKIIEPDKKNTLAEVDIMLENGDIVVVVEVKARAKREDVEDHVIRMEKLRRYADRRGDKRWYQGAVAAAILDDSLRQFILGQGFYLIEQTGDTVRINIPEGFNPKNW